MKAKPQKQIDVIDVERATQQSSNRRLRAERPEFFTAETPFGRMTIDSWSPIFMLVEAELMIHGVTVEVEMGLRWRGGVWHVSSWWIRPQGFDNEPYCTRNEQGTITAIDFKKLNRDMRLIPNKAANRAYDTIVAAARAWAAAHPEEMREMQRNSMRSETQIIRRDLRYALDDTMVEAVRARFLWTKQHGQLDGSKLGAREYGRLLRTLESARRQIEHVTKCLPPRLGRPLAG